MKKTRRKGPKDDGRKEAAKEVRQEKAKRGDDGGCLDSNPTIK